MNIGDCINTHIIVKRITTIHVHIIKYIYINSCT